jgi:hypothetical protein
MFAITPWIMCAVRDKCHSLGLTVQQRLQLVWVGAVGNSHMLFVADAGSSGAACFSESPKPTHEHDMYC